MELVPRDVADHNFLKLISGPALLMAVVNLHEKKRRAERKLVNPVFEKKDLIEEISRILESTSFNESIKKYLIESFSKTSVFYPALSFYSGRDSFIISNSRNVYSLNPDRLSEAKDEIARFNLALIGFSELFERSFK